MKREDQRRILASVAALLAMPFYFFCGINHVCMCGHLAHSPYFWYDFANDFVWLALLAMALVFAFRSNLQEKSIFIFLTALILMVRVLGDEVLGLAMAVGLVVAGIRNLRRRKVNNAGANSMPPATPDSSPSPEPSVSQDES